jgi:hypothetical protein
MTAAVGPGDALSVVVLSVVALSAAVPASSRLVLTLGPAFMFGDEHAAARAMATADVTASDRRRRLMAP